MAEYYLMSQLPSLDGIGESMPVPITEERFTELCSRFLGKKAQTEVSKLTLTPSREPAKTSSALVAAWNEGERKLRLALGKVRADRMHKSFDTGKEHLPVELMKIANRAVESENPLEAERILDSYRMEFLDSIRPMDSFSEDAVFHYGLKLKLILRIRQFDRALGESAYRNIYSSIMDGDKSEVTQ